VYQPVMRDFWDTVLLPAGLYHRNALHPQRDLTTSAELPEVRFARWPALWGATVDERQAGKRAELTTTQANRLAGSIHRRLHGQQAGEFVTIQPRHPEWGPP
jgi:hemoglobin